MDNTQMSQLPISITWYSEKATLNAPSTPMHLT